MKKEANKGAISAGLGLLGVTISHFLGQGLDYNNTEKTISYLGGASNAGLPYAFAPGTNMKGIYTKAPAIMVASELPAAMIRGVRAFVESQKAQQAKDVGAVAQTVNATVENKKSLMDYALPLGVGALGLAALPAIFNVSRAADRLGDGRALKLSTSIRKRPNDPSDLKLVVMSKEEQEREQMESEAKNKARARKRNENTGWF